MTERTEPAEVPPYVNFAVFDGAGAIIRTGRARRNRLASMAGAGEHVREGDFAVPQPVQSLPTPAMVKKAAARRLRRTDWMVIRASEGGAAVPSDVTESRARIRQRSGEIEVLTPIPVDFDAEHYWL